MAYIGRDNFTSDNKFTYYSVLAVSLVIIVILHFVLRKKEHLRQRRQEELQYGRYDDKDNRKTDVNDNKQGI